MRVYFHKVNLSFKQGVTRTTTFVLRSMNIYEVPFNLLTLNQDAAVDLSYTIFFQYWIFTFCYCFYDKFDKWTLFNYNCFLFALNFIQLAKYRPQKIIKYFFYDCIIACFYCFII